ncbi:hypothetical protein GCM10009682_56780 [Luedemannella flava]|uniref:Uncharacterized protein n=1 Tax=Luedemannella flava TaxID=349316 RepID=A0ABN2ML22_9ACTN
MRPVSGLPPIAPRQGPRAPRATSTPAPLPSAKVSRPRRRGRGRDESGISDEAFWAFMKGND